MCDATLESCRICGAKPRIEHFGSSVFCPEYICEIECPEGDHGKSVGTSLDNAIEAQREAEEKWNLLNEKTPELLPCPFCGGKASIEPEDTETFIVGCSGWNMNVEGHDGYCHGHRFHSPKYICRPDAAAAWNRRESPATEEGEE